MLYICPYLVTIVKIPRLPTFQVSCYCCLCLQGSGRVHTDLGFTSVVYLHLLHVTVAQSVTLSYLHVIKRVYCCVLPLNGKRIHWIVHDGPIIITGHLVTLRSRFYKVFLSTFKYVQVYKLCFNPLSDSGI